MGGQIKDSAAVKEKKKTLKIQQPATEGLKAPTMENLCYFQQKDDGCDCWRMSAGADASASEADQKLNKKLRGFQQVSAESILNLTRHQTLRCLQDNWKNNRGEVDCAMLCASGNKEIHSTQRAIHEVKPT